jgi:hypothetical protein
MVFWALVLEKGEERKVTKKLKRATDFRVLDVTRTQGQQGV